ncbi:MAG: hypothetical protein Q4C06_02735 [Bacillota bacterium]|nr:hypothetical protein [Bacillota bacterium]
MDVLLILLGILKWIGIVLLALLLLILLILLVVLLSPIRYRLMGQKQEAVGGSFDVSWLFGAVKVRGSYTPTEKAKLLVKVLWFTLVDTEKKQAEDTEAKKTAEEAQPQKKAVRKDAPKPETAEKQQEVKAEEPKKPKERPQAQRMAEKQPKTVRRVQLSEIVETPPDNLEEDFFTGEEEEKKKKGLPPIVGLLWSIEEKKEIFRALEKLLKRLIGGILPGDLFVRATIGAGDPAATGYVLAAAGVLTAKFGNDIQIKGDFTKAGVEDVELRLKGKIVLGVLLWAVLAFVLTKPVRKAIWKGIKFLRGKDV